MQFIQIKIDDVIIIDSHVHGDEIDYFLESFREDKLESFLLKDANLFSHGETIYV